MLVLGHSETLPCLDSLRAVHHSESSTSNPRFSDAYTARNTSCPVSPLRIPLPQQLSPKNVSGRLSPSSASSPQATSGASTPVHIRNRVLTSCHRKQPTNSVNGGTGMVSRSRTTSHLNANDREEHKPDIFRGIVQAHLLMDKRERSGSKIVPPIARDQKERVYSSPLILSD